MEIRRIGSTRAEFDLHDGGWGEISKESGRWIVRLTDAPHRIVTMREDEIETVLKWMKENK